MNKTKGILEIAVRNGRILNGMVTSPKKLCWTPQLFAGDKRG